MNSPTSVSGFDVIVVGNGALGSSLAVELAGRHASVALVGRAHRPYAASSAAGAMLGCFGEVTTSLLDNAYGQAKFDLDLKAKDIWPQWLQTISGGVSDGRDILTASGTTVLLNTVGTDHIDSGNFAAIRAMLDKYDEPYERVDPDDIAWLDPDPNSRPLEALHIPGEHAVDSGRLLRRLERTARDRGVRVVDAQATAVVTDGDRASGVVLDNGETLSAGQVVLASGVGSQDLVESVPGLGDLIPRLVAGYGVSVEMTTQDGTQPESVIRTPNRAFACGLHVVPRGMARVYVGATNIINPRPLANPVLRDLEFLIGCAHRQIRRNLWSSDIVKINVGNRPVSLDGFPLLGETPLDGLWMMTGTYRDGLFLSPLLAREFAGRLSGDQPELDLEAFAPERAPLAGVSRETVIDTTVEHMLATGYEHHWNIPTDWQEYLAADLKPIYTRWADEIDTEFTPPPELLASSRLHPTMVEWMRSYYDNCRERFGPPARSESPTLRDHVEKAQETLAAAQVWTPRKDALALAAHATDRSVEDLDLNAAIPGDTAETFRTLVRRRADRVPLEYLTGRARLFDLEFDVSEGVFIPRVHSEAMVRDALARCAAERPRVVDLCTGSGAIGLSIAHLRPGATVTGVDVSATAVQCAKRNAEQLGARIPAGVDFLQGDVSDPALLSDLQGGVDLITANPPYVPHSLQIPPEWAVHQPREAVYSGWDGLDLTRSVAATAVRLLRKGGVLAIEHYDAVADEVIDILRSAGFASLTSHTDHDGFPRYVIAEA
ncbi:protein-(glutamine-N5) methyltransferase, release factor-specific [Nocardiopsis gilva YIM 90087]|uniref:Protein-(Glutamine-N5) methyltransferase, release factor-specific n=1 Tax=Nocardiopsis gilva YIM 90087 TaxID=1235441 RepID=A0A223S9V4_9ACTN|nr:peptide chain release factor N(5)-glutamine methyltransferase [Nocardiopsis gilva]ASU84915.1 protein-(glutamine-N5) methyltransferase, release factor-specific [Nocardiopsis gilva YIM 90087]